MNLRVFQKIPTVSGLWLPKTTAMRIRQLFHRATDLTFGDRQRAGHRLVRLALATMLFVLTAGLGVAGPLSSTADAQQEQPAVLSIDAAQESDETKAQEPLAASKEQVPAVEPEPAEAGYLSGLDLLPTSVVCMAQISNLPRFCQQWRQTDLGQLLKSDKMQPFIDAQRQRASDFLASVGKKIGVKPMDLYELGSGEIVVAWMSFNQDHRPYAVSVIADIRGNKAKADQQYKEIDANLVEGGAKKKEVTYGDETIIVYEYERKPGQLTIDELAICYNDERLIVSDRETVIQDLLDVIAGKTESGRFAGTDSYQELFAKLKTVNQAEPLDGADEAMRWYANPFEVGKIIRQMVKVERVDELDIIALLQRNGFDFIKAIGGVGSLAGDRYDVLHQGVILAPGKLEKGAKILQSFNGPDTGVPGWISNQAGSFAHLYWRIETAFWAAEPVINDALAEDIFRPVLEGIRDDPQGPMIDLAKDFLPHLGDEIVLLSESDQTDQGQSGGFAIAIEVTDAEKITTVVGKAMKAEPSAKPLEVDTFEAWQIQNTEELEEDLDDDLKDLFGDGGEFGDESEEANEEPLFDHIALGVITSQDEEQKDYLVFANSAELLLQVGNNIHQGAGENALSKTTDTKTVMTELQRLCGPDQSYAAFGVVRPSVSLRARYELFRQGKLKQGDSFWARLLRRVVQPQGDKERQPIDGSTLPPFSEIQDSLNSGGGFWVRTDFGWAFAGFILNQPADE